MRQTSDLNHSHQGLWEWHSFKRFPKGKVSCVKPQARQSRIVLLKGCQLGTRSIAQGLSEYLSKQDWKEWRGDSASIYIYIYLVDNITQFVKKWIGYDLVIMFLF